MNELMSQAELNMTRTVAVIEGINKSLVMMGILLYQNCEAKMYSSLGFDSFKDYCAELKSLAYDKMVKYKNAGAVICRGLLGQEEAEVMCESNLFALYPVLDKSGRDEALIELAKYAPTRDFAEHIGRKVKLDKRIACPNCGYEFSISEVKK